MFSDEQKFWVYNPSPVWGKHLTLTKGYISETYVYFFKGICYFLVFSVMKYHHSIHHSLSEVRSCFGHKYLSLSSRLAKAAWNKTATNLGPVSRKSHGNFPGPESCSVIAVFTVKINVSISLKMVRWIETIVNEATSLWARKCVTIYM